MTRSTQLSAAALAVTALRTMGLDEDTAVLTVAKAAEAAGIRFTTEDVQGAITNLEAVTP